MKISSSRNIFDLLYLDILENSMENILSLNCGEECRSLTCFLQQWTQSVALQSFIPEGGVIEKLTLFCIAVTVSCIKAGSFLHFGDGYILKFKDYHPPLVKRCIFQFHSHRKPCIFLHLYFFSQYIYIYTSFSLPPKSEQHKNLSQADCLHTSNCSAYLQLLCSCR